MDNCSNLLMDEVPPDLRSPDGENNDQPASASDKRPPACTKGVAMSFGFKRRAATAPVASNASAARRLANADIVDGNGNEHTDTDILTEHAVPTGRTTPRLAPPKKEANATKQGSRFGFRHNQVNRLNKVADLNSQQQPCDFGNNINQQTTATKRPTSICRPSSAVDSNRGAGICRVGLLQPQTGRFTLQSTQLPRPEPIRLIETKSAKTLANNNRKVAMYRHADETSSKDGSLTEDSGLGSHFSGYMGDNDTGQELERLESSPILKRRFPAKPRTLEMVSTSNNTFNVRDRSDSNQSILPIPKLPSAFNTMDNNRSAYQMTGIVRERTMEYERNRRKISITSSEGFSDDYGEEEKNYKDCYRNEKPFIKPTVSSPNKTFLKSRPAVREMKNIKDDSSPPSSDQEWLNGGEAMADEISFSLSSSDESKEKVHQITSPGFVQALLKSANASVKSDAKNIVLNLEDSKFEQIAAASTNGTLLDDETLSPANSPGTPTNASNSLSLSEGKDDFLIDDEIADQPALVFEDNIQLQQQNDAMSVSISENTLTLTMVESSAKVRRRRNPAGFEGSPLMTRSKKFLHSRTGSLDTLSPCESIASDDLMMDYDYSQGSGLDDDRQSSGFPSFDQSVTNKDIEFDKEDGLRNWTSLIGNYSADKSNKSNATRTRLLRSRASTPSSVPDSPRSLDGRATSRTRTLATGSPAKTRIGQLTSAAGYDSDDSVRLDRANHTAMKQDIISIKTMLLKLRRVLNEQTDEELLLRSDTHNPFESQAILTNGLFNSGLNSLTTSDSTTPSNCHDDNEEARVELAELRRQVLFLQGQLEDKDKTVLELQDRMIKLANDNYHANSAPASTVSTDSGTCNAATQTERIRPISAGPSLLNGSDGNNGSLVSVTESRRSRPPIQSDSPAAKRTPSRLWRKPGEPPSPQRYASNPSSASSTSSIPRRANSRTRAPSTIT
ncbi:unnamed protein product [Brassicogethes aeneus]|uniref:Uncharacterized protein n=1 Tax=Brassicogethes aeneus TaxID=1431903 RepID=A0A9P0B0T2_BRAAE|nr:unnamed protein product [Brassicogethes aeneus]